MTLEKQIFLKLNQKTVDQATYFEELKLSDVLNWNWNQTSVYLKLKFRIFNYNCNWNINGIWNLVTDS